jgi:hypothetical protein
MCFITRSEYLNTARKRMVSHYSLYKWFFQRFCAALRFSFTPSLAIPENENNTTRRLLTLNHWLG